VIGITIAIGPVLGGLLVDGIGWRSVFWISVPIGVLALILTSLFVPESKAARARRFDLPGQVLIIVLFASVIAATIEGPDRGWGDGWIIVLFVLTALALVAILLVEPLTELRFFRSPSFSGANGISLLMTASLGGLLFLSTLYLQDVRGFTPLQAGLTIIPLAATQAIAANVSGRLVAAGRDRIALALGGGLIALGAFELVFLTVDTNIVYVLAAFAIFGFGAGLIGPPVSHTAISGLPADQTGVAGAIAASARQFGSAIGVAVTGSLVATTGGDFIDSSHTAWAVLAAAGLAALGPCLLPQVSQRSCSPSSPPALGRRTPPPGAANSWRPNADEADQAEVSGLPQSNRRSQQSMCAVVNAVKVLYPLPGDALLVRRQHKRAATPTRWRLSCLQVSSDDSPLLAYRDRGNPGVQQRVDLGFPQRDSLGDGTLRVRERTGAQAPPRKYTTRCPPDD